MGSIRRRAGSCITSLVAVLTVLAFVLAPASASAAAVRSATTAQTATAAQTTAPVQMSYACALKSNGLMRYVSSKTQCKGNETLVTIVPGPHYACVRSGNSVFLVSALSKCPVPPNVAALTLPPTSSAVFFCASGGSGVLSYTTRPSSCTSKLVEVQPVPPALANIETTALPYYAGTPPVTITSTLTVSSPATTNLVGATVRISSGLVAAEDSLGFTSQNGITGSYNSSTGVLTLTGTSSVADYQAALRSVTYKDSNALTAGGTRTISLQVNDGLSSANLSNVVSRSINVKTNAAPTCTNVSASTGKNTAIDISVLPGCSDVDGDMLGTPTVNTSGGTKGSVSVNANGTIHYNPNGQFQNLLQGQTATDTFTYTVSDGFQNSAPATVKVMITGVNDAPVLANIETSALAYVAPPSVPVTSTLTVSSPDTTTLAGATVTISSGLAASEDSLGFTTQNGITGSYNSSTGVLTLTGTASVANYQAALRSVTYTDSNATGASATPRNISFQVDDGLASSNLSNTVSRTVNVSPNSPPAADNVKVSTDKNTPVVINVLASASDPDGDTVTLVDVGTAGTAGKVTINPDSTVTYNPNGRFQNLTKGQTATDTFTYTVSDGFSTATGMVTVTIFGVNDLPVISNVETTPLDYQAQQPPVAITSTLTIADDDDTAMGGATVSITSGFDSGADTLGFVTQNGITGSYDASTGVLTLTGNASLADYQAALLSVTFFTSDNSASPAARTVSFQVTDSVGAASNSESRTIDVSEAAQPPVISNVETTPASYTVASAAVAVTSTLTIADSDDTTMSGATVSITSGFDSGADTLSFTNQNGITGSYNGATGVLTLTGDASLADYQAALRSVTFSTTDSSASPAARTVSFTVTDTNNETSNTASRTIDVTAAAQPPTAVNQSYAAVGNTTLAVGTTANGPAAILSASAGLLAGDSGDASCGTLTVTGNTAPAHGTVSGVTANTVNTDGTFSYLPAAGFSGTDTFQYTITCGSSRQTATATVTITVGPVVWYVNDALGSAGTGQSTAPFSTLAAANSAAGADSIIFLYQGGATYTGGLTMKPGEDLWGQPHGLTVDGFSLVAAGGSNPTITNTTSGGDGIDLASNVDIENVTVSDANTYGINGQQVTGTVKIANSTVTAAGVDNAIITDTSGTLNLTVTGSTFSNSTASDTSNNSSYGLIVNADGSTDATVSVTGSTLTGNTGDEFSFTTDSAATGTDSVTFSDNQVSGVGIDGGGGSGASIQPHGDNTTTITIDGNNIQNVTDNGIGVQNEGSGTLSGTINGNTVGSPTVANSGGSNSISAAAQGAGTETLAITSNKLYQYDDFAGIYYIDHEGSPALNLTITGNTLADPAGNAANGGAWGIYGEAGGATGDAGTVCADITGNSLTGAGQASLGSADIELDQNIAGVTYELPGYTGGSTDTSAVQTFLADNNNSGGTPSTIATVVGAPGFVGGSSCPSP